MATPSPERGLGSRGTVLVIVLLILMVALTIIPLMVFFSQNESKWSVKQDQTTSAFHLAEAAIERGYLQLTISTENWKTIQNGGTIAGYRFDKDYTDIAGGDYTIWIGSTTGDQAALVMALGRNSNRKEVRGIEAVYSKASFGNVAIQAMNGVSITGNNFEVEWGAVVTPKNIVAGGRTYPQFWSANNIDLDSNGASPPNCDGPGCCQWHSYSTNIPPLPPFDLDAYKQLAIAAGTGPCGAYYQPGTFTFSACNDNSGNTYYIGSDASVVSSGGGNYVVGNVIVIGNLSLPSGVWANGSETVPVPQDAWKQYCNNWAHYQAFDPGAPASFPGLTSTYLASSSLTYTVPKIFVHGLLYVGKDINTGNGGGGSGVVGAIYVGGAANIAYNSPVIIYFNNAVASNILTTSVILGRASWQEMPPMGFPFP